MSKMKEVYCIMEELRPLELSLGEIVARLLLCEDKMVRHALVFMLSESIQRANHDAQ